MLLGNYNTAINNFRKHSVFSIEFALAEAQQGPPYTSETERPLPQ